VVNALIALLKNTDTDAIRFERRVANSPRFVDVALVSRVCSIFDDSDPRSLRRVYSALRHPSSGACSPFETRLPYWRMLRASVVNALLVDPI